MYYNPTRPERKKRAIRQRLGRLGPRSVILCQDETDLLLFPPLRACWAKRGQPAEVALAGTNARRVVFGALNVRTGHRLFLVRTRQRGEDFRVFLQTLHHHYRGWHVVLVLDADSAHTARASQHLAAQLGIELLWLPTRCPELNPLEALWRSGKQTICANRQYPTIDEVVERFLVYLYWLSPREARRKAGLLSKHCWLKSHT
jgi:transposase